jgi:hypothetical protein
VGVISSSPASWPPTKPVSVTQACRTLCAILPQPALGPTGAPCSNQMRQLVYRFVTFGRSFPVCPCRSRAYYVFIRTIVLSCRTHTLSATPPHTSPSL